MDFKYPLGKVINLGSSSNGNAFYIELYRKDYPNPFRLLIECGFDFQELSKRLLNKGISINDINAILVTHEHNDHSISVPQLVARKKKVYAPMTVFEKYKLSSNIDSKYVMENKTEKGIADGIIVTGMELDHENDDGSKTYNLGYIITVDKWFNILFVTDTKFIRYDLSGYQFNVIFIEANNLHRVIYSALQNAQQNHNKWEEIHFNRVLKSHMLVEKTALTLATFDLKKTDIIYLIHLSANTIINTFEFKGIVKNKLIETEKYRKVYFIDKKDNIKKMTYKPKLAVAKRNGDWA
jgi:phosphoribosyl 1,2-cyclic phosphodiesterase